MNLKQKILQIAFWCAVGVFVTQTFILDIRQFEIALKESHDLQKKFVIVNKLYFGLNIPFINQKLFSWQHATKGQNIIFNNKNGQLQIAEVISVPGEVIFTDQRRDLIPPGYLFVKLKNDLNTLGFIQEKNILGGVAFMIK